VLLEPRGPSPLLIRTYNLLSQLHGSVGLGASREGLMWGDRASPSLGIWVLLPPKSWKRIESSWAIKLNLEHAKIVASCDARTRERFAT
jgi:hypothetical protein